MTAPLSPRLSERNKSGHVGAFGLPLRTTLPTDGADAQSPREKGEAVDSGPISAFGLPLRTKLPENTALRLTAGMTHFELNTSLRVEMGEAMSSHLEILKEMSELNAELEAAIVSSSAVLEKTDPDLCNQLSGLLSHQQNLKRYQMQIIDELFASFVQPYHLLLDPASGTEFDRLEHLQKTKDPSELLAILELLASTQEQDTVHALTSFISLYATTFESSQKSLDGFSKLLSILHQNDAPKQSQVFCAECAAPKLDDGAFCGDCGSPM